MFEDKKNEGFASEPNFGMKFMMAMSVETSLEFNKLVTELIQKYKANNIDVIPITELEKCQCESMKKALGENSLLSSIMKGE